MIQNDPKFGEWGFLGSIFTSQTLPGSSGLVQLLEDQNRRELVWEPPGSLQLPQGIVGRPLGRRWVASASPMIGAPGAATHAEAIWRGTNIAMAKVCGYRNTNEI